MRNALLTASLVAWFGLLFGAGASAQDSPVGGFEPLGRFPCTVLSIEGGALSVDSAIQLVCIVQGPAWDFSLNGAEGDDVWLIAVLVSPDGAVHIVPLTRL